MSTYTYQFAVLRYVHDIVTGEFLNVGVALYCKEVGYFGALTRSQYRRLSQAFPGIDGDHYRRVMAYIERQISSLHGKINPTRDTQRIQGTLFQSLPDDIASLLAKVLPPDDSSLVFGSFGGGITDDPAAELGRLQERMVERYISNEDPETRTDDQVWHAYKAELDRHQVTQHLQGVTIKAPTYSYEFEHAWKNDRWHPIEPVSFDLKLRHSILEKANHWIGRVANLADNDELGTLYMLVGAPSREELLEPYADAVRSLEQKIRPYINVEIVEEKDAAQFSYRLAREIQQHQPDPPVAADD